MSILSSAQSRESKEASPSEQVQEDSKGQVSIWEKEDLLTRAIRSMRWYDIPKDCTGIPIEVGDRVEHFNHQTHRRYTVTYVYPDSNGCIDCRVLEDLYSEEKAVHGSCMRII